MPASMVIREVLRMRKVVLLGLAALFILVLFEGWFTDYRSCRRQVPVRQFQIDRNPVLAQHFRVKPLDCGRILPED